MQCDDMVVWVELVLCSGSQWTRVVGILPPTNRTRSSPRTSHPPSMMPNSPHFLLFSEASQDESSATQWRFVLQNVCSKRKFSAKDSEPSAVGRERLELLAVVRGLEALEGPSRVTLVTRSRYVSRGIKQGLREWRENDWKWERFGRIVPVRDHDLWQRIDRALQFHEIDCQAWIFDQVGSDSELAAQPVALPRERTLRVQSGRASTKRSRKRRRSREWSTRWTEALDAISKPMGLSLGQASAT